MIEQHFDPAIKEIQQRLDELETSLRNKAISSGLTAAAKPVKDEIKRRAPYESGALKKSIGQRKLSKTAKGRIGIDADTNAIIVGAVRKVRDTGGKRIGQGYKASFLEFGTKNMDPHPFIKPAIDAAGGDIDRRFYQGIRRYLDRKAL